MFALRAPYLPPIVGVGCGCMASPKPVQSAAEAEALSVAYSPEERRQMWLRVGNTAGQPAVGAESSPAPMVATVLTAMIIGSAVVMMLFAG